jgi:hypothetical protein
MVKQEIYRHPFCNSLVVGAQYRCSNVVITVTNISSDWVFYTVKTSISLSGTSHSTKGVMDNIDKGWWVRINYGKEN